MLVIRYLHPEKHATEGHIVLHQASEVLVSRGHHQVSSLSVEILNLCHMGVEPFKAPLVE